MWFLWIFDLIGLLTEDQTATRSFPAVDPNG